MIYNGRLWIAVCPHRSVFVPKEHNSFGGYSYRPTVCQPCLVHKAYNLYV